MFGLRCVVLHGVQFRIREDWPKEHEKDRGRERERVGFEFEFESK